MGNGSPVGASFTVQIVDANKTVLDSSIAEIESDGSVGNTGDFGATLQPGPNGWPKNSTLTIQAVCSGTVIASVTVDINSF